MPTLDVIVESGVDLSIRARQVCGMFDCPPQDKQRLHWNASLPIEEKPWNIGLIVGPSGSGKSVCAKSLWPIESAYALDWDAPTLIDCFDSGIGIADVTAALSSVGFSTIPAWLRPYSVLSNGERFRAEIARRLIEQPGVIVIDEFTSVVDRQVATVACHAVQKFVRKRNRQLVAVTCHGDVIDWLQPDWVFEPAERAFRWRSLQRRPAIQVELARIPYEAWYLFAPYHYMSAKLNKAARCFGLWANGELASFAAVLHRPHPKAKNIKGLSRLVTLPDWQGLGFAFVLTETLGAAYKTMGFRYRNYPAHPVFVRAFRADKWRCDKMAGTYGHNIDKHRSTYGDGTVWKRGTLSPLSARPCATFEYIGPTMEKVEAEQLIEGGATATPGDFQAPNPQLLRSPLGPEW